MIRLEPDDPQVRALTIKAFRDCQGRDAPLTLHCDRPRCWATLAMVGATQHGFLFTAWWKFLRTLTDEEVVMDRFSTDVRVSGSPIDRYERESVIALLALPPDVPPDYPGLMVRCTTHGDKLLDRLDVFKWLRLKQSDMPVHVEMPRLEPRPNDHTFYEALVAAGAGTQRKSNVTRRIGFPTSAFVTERRVSLDTTTEDTV